MNSMKTNREKYVFFQKLEGSFQKKIENSKTWKSLKKNNSNFGSLIREICKKIEGKMHKNVLYIKFLL